MNNVAVFSHVFPPNLNVSSFRVSSYCRTLNKAGYKVTVFTNSDQNGENFLTRFVEDVSIVSKSFGNNNANFFLYFYWALKVIFSKKFDVVIITGGPFYYFPLSIFFKMFGVKTILDFRDPWCLRPEVNKKKYRIYKYVEYLSILCSEYVVFVNDYVKNLYSKEYFTFRERFYVVENGYFNLSSFSLRNETLETEVDMQLKNMPSQFTVVYSGKVIYRDLSNFMYVLKERNDIKLIKMGPKEKVFDDLVCSFGLRDRVVDLGLLPYEDAALVMSKFADFCVLVTSRYSWEASTKVFEGLQYGIPVLAIAPDVSYVNDVIGYCDSGVRVNNNTSDISEGIKEILSGTFTFKNYQKYDREMQAEKILKLIKRCQSKGVETI